MEDPSSDSGQSTNGAEPELDPMELYDNEESRSHTVDDSNGQSSMDVDRKQLSVDADMNGKPSLDGDGKGKYSESHAEVPIDMSLGSLERFCKEASRSFFDEVGLISHQINSYNEFVSHGLQELFDSLGEVTVEPGYDSSKKGTVGGWRRAVIRFGRVKLEKPVFWSGKDDIDEESLKLKPRHARLQNMTYSSKMEVEVHIQIYSMEKSDKSKTENDVFGHKRVLMDETHLVSIGRLPVMVNSNLCWLHELKESDCLFDSGGYFLIRGMEKIFIAQEQRCLTRIWVADRPVWTVSYLSEIKRRRIYVKLIDSTKNDDFSGSKIISISFLYANLPIWLMFFALGIPSDKEAFDMIDMGDCDASVINAISATIRESDELCEGFRKSDKARQCVDDLVKSSKFPPGESFDDYVDKYLFPGIKGNRNKAFFLGYMVKCLLMAFTGKRRCDNKDDFRNKRLELPGQLLGRELRAQLRHAERLMVKAMQRDMNSDRDLEFPARYLDASIITNGIIRAFATGSWCHPYKRNERCSGIVATLRRTNPLQMMSDLRKSRQQVAYAGKAGDARYPNPSYWGKMCFMSTPDGENCGLVKNLAVTAIVSSRVAQPLIDRFVSCGMNKLDEIPAKEIPKMDKIFLNGDWVGSCADPASFVMRLRCMRRGGLIDPQVEIKRDKHQSPGEVRVFSDAGRLLRPLLVVENLNKITKRKGCPYSFQALMQQEIIEFIGVEEEEDIQCAWGIRHLFQSSGEEVSGYTHCELDLSFLLGLSCSLIPFANHNFARRVLYQAEKHSQQAIGYSTTNPRTRVDTLSHQLFYPQRPLFKTVSADCIGRSDYTFGRKDDFARPEYFNGQNAIVAVNIHQGFNQEDSLVMNRASLERGMFRTELMRSYKAEVETKGPSKRLKMKEKVNFGKMESKRGRVDNLDDDGLPYVGSSLQIGDIIIGKVSESGEDHSIKLKHTEKGMVQRVLLSANDEGKHFAVVSLRQVRSPCVGDKFSSMHGQKGVVGFLESQENFPFTCQGIVPDIVINPHAFPTRQTPGQLLEAALGKGIALGGKIRYATPFTTATVEVISEQLHKLGFSRGGVESVLNGQTGKRMQSLIFAGPNFYQRLIHMAEDKVKFRNTGPVHPLTRQPVADRKRFGGVKFGEMERDCLLAHGAAANLHERLFTLSDFSEMRICQTCERAANVIMRPVSGGRKIRGPYCGFCRSSEKIVKIAVPYGAKLLYQELFSMGICLKFQTEVC
ncbi:DNA-directed RNA polymerases IV and V subunit 2-like [Hordeum vulgare subsp. vulgare]|uniref:DNA-directed RNA polymerases IV and V subunit 2-like n=1 Tax=Hordeum vulgare subsp. vulgare TaxID=112509 RepID=UPI001B8581CE|nr:DNA-directed RNA polymerases IV and V subunit 2-like [Hordeum vulgare subsp. vulgare]